MFQKQSPEVFFTKGILKISQNLEVKNLNRNLFFNKIADLQIKTPR